MGLTRHEKNNQVLFYIALFMPILGTNILVYAYLCLYFLFHLFQHSNRYSFRGRVIAVLIITFVIIKYFQVGEFDNTRIVIQYYYGAALFLYYLDSSCTLIYDIDKLIKVLCAEIILEAVLVNTIIPPSAMPGYSEAYIQYSGYQRPLSIGNNTTVTATIVCMLLAYREMLRKKGILPISEKIDVIGGLTIIVMASGMGIGLWGIYLLYRMKGALSGKNFKIIMGVVALIVMLSFFPAVRETISFHLFGDDGDEIALQDFKVEETEQYLSKIEGFSVLIGLDFKNTPVLTQGDLAYLEMFLDVGVMGIAVFIIMVLPFLNKYNRFPIIIGLIGLYHYGGIFSMPGQMIFAYLLLFNKQKFTQLLDVSNRLGLKYRLIVKEYDNNT